MQNSCVYIMPLNLLTLALGGVVVATCGSKIVTNVFAGFASQLVSVEYYEKCPPSGCVTISVQIEQVSSRVQQEMRCLALVSGTATGRVVQGWFQFCADC